MGVHERQAPEDQPPLVLPVVMTFMRAPVAHTLVLHGPRQGLVGDDHHIGVVSHRRAQGLSLASQTLPPFFAGAGVALTV